MRPRFAAVSGPLVGETIPVSKPEWWIGRAESVDLRLNDDSVSRRHCCVRREGDKFTIHDAESRNGTFVDSIPIKEHILQHGDTIEIGDSVFVFLLHEDAQDASSLQLLQDHLPAVQSTAELRREDSVYLDSEKIQKLLPRGIQIADDLNTLLKFTREIVSAGSKIELFDGLLKSMADVFPCDRASIMLRDSKMDEFITMAVHGRNAGDKTHTPLNRSIIAQVLERSCAMLFNEIGEGATSTLLCAPMHVRDKVIGMILFESDSAAGFRDRHLQLISAVASMTAMAVDNLTRSEWLENENQRLQKETRIAHQMIGQSAPMNEIYSTIEKVAPTDCTVVITGETGTGKELVARAIHDNSSRSCAPFIAINCAVLSETLLESELFGHEKGAFTGAVALKKGKMEIADSGSLFLDEIAELSLPLQAKLLRALQTRQFERLGGTRTIHVDIRLLAATNKNLKDEVKKGTFREDLYFRLNVVLLTVPPLRDRKEDISLLTNYFVTKYSRQFNKRISGVASEARAYLLRYDWPGNIGELENAIERAVVLSDGEIISPEDLPESILEIGQPPGVNASMYQDAILDAKKRVIQQAVTQAKGNYAEAAKLLGVQRTYLHRVMRHLNLKEPK